MDYDQSELLAMMYQSDEPETRRPDAVFDPSGFARSRRLRVGAIEYEVPTVAYVHHLEQLLAGQARVIDGQRAELSRLNKFMMATRNFIRRQTGRISEMQRDLEAKVDLREGL